MRLRSIILAISHRICCWLISISSSPSGVVVVYLYARSVWNTCQSFIFEFLTHVDVVVVCARAKFFFCQFAYITTNTTEQPKKQIINSLSIDPVLFSWTFPKRVLCCSVVVVSFVLYRLRYYCFLCATEQRSNGASSVPAILKFPAEAIRRFAYCRCH